MKLERPCSPELDSLLGVQLSVLHDGFVRVVDYMGDDAAIVQAARVSYGTGTKRLRSDRQLLRYLMRHSHTTPFEMCEIKLHVRVPMDCWRQWIRHRTANVNEYSTRYSEAIDAAQTTLPGEWRLQTTSSRQGSEGFLDAETGARVSDAEAQVQKVSREAYESRLRLGIAREQARKDLPLSTFTEAYWKIDLHNLLHFLQLRMAPAAQAEIRSYAETIGYRVVAAWCPLAWEAFLDYRVDAVNLSRFETAIIGAIVRGDNAEVVRIARENHLVSGAGAGFLLTREGEELERKLVVLGFGEWFSTRRTLFDMYKDRLDER